MCVCVRERERERDGGRERERDAFDGDMWSSCIDEAWYLRNNTALYFKQIGLLYFHTPEKTGMNHSC